MDFFSVHPITIALALISCVVWTAGRSYRKKIFIIFGVLLSVAAIVAFAFGK